MTHYIMDHLSSLVKTGRRGEPSSLTLPEGENREYADRFYSKEQAQQRLDYWVKHHGFKGRVVNEQDLNECGE